MSHDNLSPALLVLLAPPLSAIRVFSAPQRVAFSGFGHNIVRRRPAPARAPFLSLTAVLAIAISIARSLNSFGRLSPLLSLSLDRRGRRLLCMRNCH